MPSKKGKYKHVYETTASISELLPAIVHQQYIKEEFIPVKEEHTDQETTIADLRILNNHLALYEGLLPYLCTVDALCKVSLVVNKLIEMRRKVKKLKMGDYSNAVSGRTFEVID